MKKILVATDFSPAARNAVLYGIQLAKAMNTNIFLFSAYHVAHPFAALNVQVSHLAVMADTKQKLADEANTFKEYDTQIDIVCEEGTPHEAILAIAEEIKVDLIIIGTKGRGANLKKLFGSTAISLVNGVTIPVIVVPEDARFTAPKTVLYASDVLLDVNVKAVDHVKWLTDFFGSKLFVVRVVKDNDEAVRENENMQGNLREELIKLDTSFSFPIKINITDGLTEFISEQQIDLILMSPHKHEWVERLFVKSETKQMVFHTHVPILMLPDTEVAAIGVSPLEIGETYNYDDK